MVSTAASCPVKPKIIIEKSEVPGRIWRAFFRIRCMSFVCPLRSQIQNSTLYQGRCDDSSRQFTLVLRRRGLRQVLTDFFSTALTNVRFIRLWGSEAQLMLQNVLQRIACNYIVPPERSPNPQNLHSVALKVFFFILIISVIKSKKIMK